MKLALIWAMSENRAIGKDGDLPWHIPVDLKHFKSATKGCPILMGRKTWESLPGALPGRRNLVITRQSDYNAEGAEVFSSIDDALAVVQDTERCFVVGGSEIYRLTLPRADELWVTFVHADVEGDTFFPELDLSLWRLEEQTSHPAGDGNEFACTIAQLVPKSAKSKS